MFLTIFFSSLNINGSVRLGYDIALPRALEDGVRDSVFEGSQYEIGHLLTNVWSRPPTRTKFSPTAIAQVWKPLCASWKVFRTGGEKFRLA